MTFDVAELASCTRCDLSLTRQRVVIGSGPADAVLMVIGEAPGRNEDEGGEPFIGRSGRLLFRLILEEVGLERGQCFVTNVVKCRPPDNRVPRREEIGACRPWLEAQLGLFGSRAVLALGNTAARAVFGFSAGMGETHGLVQTIGSRQGLATYHPAAALRGGSIVLEAMRADLRIVRELVDPS